jgi:hypothetical protein
MAHKFFSKIGSPKLGSSNKNSYVNTKTLAKMAMGVGGVSYGAPSFYSPIHTPSSWAIPTRRREVMLWCRFFAANEPKIASALDIYSQLPITDFEIVCEDEIITEYFDEVARNINLMEFLGKIAYEYFCIGDVFVFANVQCPTCGGSGILPGSMRKDGSYIPCPHEGGTFNALTILSPDWIEVLSSSITNDEVIFLTPGNDLRNIVQRKSPTEIYNRIPDFLRAQILIGQPIQLHPMCISHLAHNKTGQGPYGRSLITRLFRTLAYKDKITQAQWIVAERHMLPIRIVKVGNDAIPASEQDIQMIQQQLMQVAQDPTVTFVTHHAIDYSFEGASGKVLQLGKEYDMIEQEMLDGLMINKALLNGEGPTINSASIGLEAFIKRLENFRKILSKYVEERIFRPIAIMQGFTTKDARGNEKPFYPKFKFKDMRLRDDTNLKNTMIQLADKKIISKQTLLEIMGIDFGVEIERLRMENIVEAEYNLGDKEDGEMGGGLGGDMGGGMPDMGGGGMPELGGMDDAAPDGAMPMPDSPASGPETSKASNSPIQRPRVSKKKQVVKNPKKPTKEELLAMQPRKLMLNIPEQKIFVGLEDAQKTGKIHMAFIPQFRPDRTRKFILDFAFPKIKLGIEVDGPLHDTPEKIGEDKEKDKFLADRGWQVYRFKEKEINESFKDKVLPTIIKLVNSRASKFTAPK